MLEQLTNETDRAYTVFLLWCLLGEGKHRSCRRVAVLVGCAHGTVGRWGRDNRWAARIADVGGDESAQTEAATRLPARIGADETLQQSLLAYAHSLAPDVLARQLLLDSGTPRDTPSRPESPGKAGVSSPEGHALAQEWEAGALGTLDVLRRVMAQLLGRLDQATPRYSDFVVMLRMVDTLERSVSGEGGGLAAGPVSTRLRLAAEGGDVEAVLDAIDADLVEISTLSEAARIHVRRQRGDGEELAVDNVLDLFGQQAVGEGDS